LDSEQEGALHDQPLNSESINAAEAAAALANPTMPSQHAGDSQGGSPALPSELEALLPSEREELLLQRIHRLEAKLREKEFSSAHSSQSIHSSAHPIAPIMHDPCPNPLNNPSTSSPHQPNSQPAAEFDFDCSSGDESVTEIDFASTMEIRSRDKSRCLLDAIAMMGVRQTDGVQVQSIYRTH
jgi:BMFP domain-containing protein YqiC